MVRASLHRYLAEDRRRIVAEKVRTAVHPGKPAATWAPETTEGLAAPITRSGAGAFGPSWEAYMCPGPRSRTSTSDASPEVWEPIVQRVARAFARWTSLELEELLAEGRLAAVEALQQDERAEGITLETFIRVRVRDAIVDRIRKHAARVERVRKDACAIALCSAFAVDTGDHQLASGRDAEGAAAKRIDVRRVLMALEQLPVREREALTLRFLDELTIEEAALLLGVRRETVWRWVTSGIERLRRTMVEGERPSAERVPRRRSSRPSASE